jgi:hypothetical protein
MESTVSVSFLAGTVVKTTYAGDNGTGAGGTHPATPGHIQWSQDIIEDLASRFEGR